MNKRLFIISNRLPVTVDAEKGLQPGSGGLVTAIESYLHKANTGEYSEVLWAGVPGCTQAVWDSAIEKIGQTPFTYQPVFVSDNEYDGYYNGVSNSVLWPLFHYFPSYAEYDLDSYASYQKVNQHFAATLIKTLRPTDTVWIHDYHLLPLAALLRKEIPDITIGFFLHIPFPSYEIFRLMPRSWQEDLLNGMLGADLIGFHTFDYAAHFLNSVLMVLGRDNDQHVIHHQNRLVKVDVFPISIDFHKFNQAYDEPGVVEQRDRFLKLMDGRKMIFSIDRLDYTKGVQNRLAAYEYFLQQYPEFHGKVVFILVVIPSRDTIQKYAEQKKAIDERISRINSKIGNIDWMPVIYQYNSLDFYEMLGLYTACDLALITPLRDGMNLVAKEFVASRKDKKGVLVISEMAGAARELTDALIINPNDLEEMARKIKEGLEMNEAEQEKRIVRMQRRISSYDVQTWANEYMLSLLKIKEKQDSYRIKFLDGYARRTLLDAYRAASRKLILLDYDGTLVGFSANPDAAVPSESLLQLLTGLGEKPGNDVFVISGRSSAWLNQHLGNLPINLIAEHGARYKWTNSEWMTDVQTDDDWKEQVRHIMEIYVKRCANSFVEEKDYSMVWHYRNANVAQGKLRSQELGTELNEFVQKRNLQVMMGNKIVEVRQSGIHKGMFVKKIIAMRNYDFTFAVGDDRTDEDMFMALLDRENTYTIKVGTEASYAQYNLHTPQMVVTLLEAMNHLSAQPAVQA